MEGVGITVKGDATRLGHAPSSTLEIETAYRRYGSKVYSLCLRFLRNPEDAEDATQETFIRASGRIDAAGDPAAYLYAIARNICRDELRRRQRSGRTEGVDTEPADRAAPGASPERTVIERHYLTTLWALLSSHDRRLLAYQFSGHSCEEIANRLGVGVSTVTAGLTRARRQARRIAEVAVGNIAAALIALKTLLGRTARRNPVLGGEGTAGLLVAAQETGVLVATVLTGLITSVATPSMGVASGAIPGPATRLQATDLAASATAARAVAAGSALGQARSVGTAQPAPSGSGQLVHAPTVVGNVLAPGRDATPDDASFSSETASPGYAQDRTVFASGSLVTGCWRPQGCPILFVSRDGGGSWTRLDAVRFGGGAIVLPPSYPHDSIMFADTPTGLERSDDNGVTFQPAAPLSGPMAVDPASALHGARVLIGSVPTAVYDARTGLLAPGPALPPEVASVDDVAFVAAGVALVSVRVADPTAPAGVGGELLRCDLAGSCVVTSVQGVSAADLPLHAGPSAEAVGAAPLVVAYSTRSVYLSSDGGQSFEARQPALGSGMAISGLGLRFDAAGRPTVVLSTVTLGSGGTPVPALYLATDARLGFSRMPASGLPVSGVINSPILLPDGRIIAPISGGDPGDLGLRCSVDGGMTWHRTCRGT